MIVMYLFESQNASFKKHVGVSLFKNKHKHTHTLTSGSNCGSSGSVVLILVEIMKVTSNSSEQFKQDPLYNNCWHFGIHIPTTWREEMRIWRYCLLCPSIVRCFLLVSDLFFSKILQTHRFCQPSTSLAKIEVSFTRPKKKTRLEEYIL